MLKKKKKTPAGAGDLRGGSSSAGSVFARWISGFQPDVLRCSRSVAQSRLTLCDPMTAECQASLSITSPQSLLKLMSIESVMPSSHLILCRPLLPPPSVFPSIRVFSRLSSRWGQKLTFLQVSAHLGEKIISKVLRPVSTPNISEPLSLRIFEWRC